MTPPRAPERETVRIGEAARRTGLTPRTLRYYEELGLLRPHSAEDAASRRYGPVEIDRLARIRELQDLLGLSLEEIRVLLEREDAMEELRARFHSDSAPASQRRVVAEAMELNRRLLERLDERIARIERFRGEIQAKVERQAARAAELAAAEEAEEAGAGS
jgi:DNA-binding transcriptional MerR regulator